MSVGHLKLSFLKSGIEQVANIVEDLNGAVESYWKLLGVGPWTIYTYERPLLKSATYRGQEAEPWRRIALAQLDSLRAELIEAVQGPSIFHDWVAEPFSWPMLVSSLQVGWGGSPLFYTRFCPRGFDAEHPRTCVTYLPGLYIEGEDRQEGSSWVKRKTAQKDMVLRRTELDSGPSETFTPFRLIRDASQLPVGGVHPRSGRHHRPGVPIPQRTQCRSSRGSRPRDALPF